MSVLRQSPPPGVNRAQEIFVCFDQLCQAKCGESFEMNRFCLLLSLACATSVFGQSGDNAGEIQTVPKIAGPVPDAPPLSVEQALTSFRLPPGFAIEVVASEPMIEAPVEIEFDPDGRMYVLEMRGFMRT